MTEEKKNQVLLTGFSDLSRSLIMEGQELADALQHEQYDFYHLRFVINEAIETQVLLRNQGHYVRTCIRKDDAARFLSKCDPAWTRAVLRSTKRIAPGTPSYLSRRMQILLSFLRDKQKVSARDLIRELLLLQTADDEYDSRKNG